MASSSQLWCLERLCFLDPRSRKRSESNSKARESKTRKSQPSPQPGPSHHLPCLPHPFVLLAFPLFCLRFLCFTCVSFVLLSFFLAGPSVRKRFWLKPAPRKHFKANWCEKQFVKANPTAAKAKTSPIWKQNHTSLAGFIVLKAAQVKNCCKVRFKEN